MYLKCCETGLSVGEESERSHDDVIAVVALVTRSELDEMKLLFFKQCSEITSNAEYCMSS